MTMVASYYANVGIDFNMASLRRAQAYLKRIERVVDQFRRRLERSSTINLDVKLRVDRIRALRTLNTEMGRLTRGLTVPLSKFNISSQSLARAINNAVTSASARGAIRLSAVLANSSLSHMRSQMVHYLSNTTLTPLIRPRVAGGGGGQGGGGRGSGARVENHGRWAPGSAVFQGSYLGGALGRFQRFGVYSLPLIAGAMGLNTLNNFAREIGMQETALNMVSEISPMDRTAEQYRNYIAQLALSAGRKQSDLTPFFTQMLAASAGKDIETQLPDAFAGIVQYASVMGVTDERLKRALVGFQQMIGKGQIMAEELKNQVGEHIPTIIPMMAQAMAGGDTQKLFKMMERGELDPNIAIPRVAAIMREQAQRFLPAYWQSLPYAQGYAGNRQEQFMRNFVSGGGDAGLTTFWRFWGQTLDAAVPQAERLGAAFEIVANAMVGMMAVGPEFFQWMTGNEQEGNFMTALFGASSESEILQNAKGMLESLYELFAAIVPRLQTAWGAFAGWFEGEGFGKRITQTIAGIQKVSIGLIDTLTHLINGDLAKAKETIFSTFQNQASRAQEGIQDIGNRLNQGKMETRSGLVNWILGVGRDAPLPDEDARTVSGKITPAPLVNRSDISMNIHVTSDGNGDSAAIQRYLQENGRTLFLNEELGRALPNSPLIAR